MKTIKTIDIKRNFAGYSENFGKGVNKIYIYKDLCIKDWRVVFNYGLNENSFWYKKDAVDFANKIINNNLKKKRVKRQIGKEI